MNSFFAAIDLGSNSCRLLITDKNGKSVLQKSSSVRLGEGIYSSKVISAEAIDRAISALQEFKKYMNEYGVVKYRAIATAAARNAKNSKEFVDLVKQKAKIDLEVVDGLEEAKLNLAGAAINADKDKKYMLVIDIGGGSAEVTLSTNSNRPDIMYSISIPWGARNASEAFGFGAYNEEKAHKLELEIYKYMDDFLKNSDYEKYKKDISVVATSSTPLRIVSMQNNFKEYSREKADGLVIDASNLNELWLVCYNMSVEDLAKSPLVGEVRSQIFIPACVIFSAISKKLNCDKMIASLKSAKDGIICDLVG